MASLKVRLRGVFTTEVPLSEDRPYVAGRREDADIRLDAEKGISREHFRIVSQQGTWILEKLSRFGDVIKSGEKIEKLNLENGTVFSVPPYEFEFVANQGQTNPSIIAHDEKTVVGQYSNLPYIKVLDDKGEAKEMIRLDGGDTYVAGREANCAIQIRDKSVSRKQFEIRKNGSTYFIVDLGSVNGTSLNGTPLQPNEPVPLKSGDSITVLENFLTFELHDPNFKSRLQLVNQNPVIDYEQPEQVVPFEQQQAQQPQQQAPLQPQYPQPQMENALTPLNPDGSAMQPGWGQGGALVQHQPNAVGAPTEIAKKGFDYKKNRPRLILGAAALLLVVYAVTNSSGSDTSTPAPAGAVDPLSKLTPEQKKMVKDTLQLAKSYYMQGKYEFARSELLKMQEVIPNFEDSESLAKLITEAINVQALQKKQEEMEKARAEQQAKIESKVAECKKLLRPDVTRSKVEECLSEVIAFDPSSPLFMELYAQAEAFTAKREADAAQRASYRAEVERLKKLYGNAKAIDLKDKPLAAIVAYGRVVASVLPDPAGLKPTSKNRISELRKQVNDKTATFQAEAAKFIEENKYKEAIFSLRKARQVDPQNPELQPKIEDLKAKLREKVMGFYQEGVLEENFGNIEGDPNKSGDENKAGAKQKWKEVIRLDVPDGDYYKKAYLKLKKYGSPE